MKKAKQSAAVPRDRKLIEREIEAGAAGAVAGGTIGAIAGPPGVVVGAAVGAIAGAVAGRAARRSDEATAEEDRELDREIGVSEGELGAPDLEHPPAKIGAYSGTSLGIAPASDDEEPAEGPMEPPRS